MPCCAGAPALTSVLHRGIEVREDIGGTSEVRGDYLPEVDRMVPGLQLADHAALQVGESLVEEWGPRLARGVWRAAEGAVLRLEGPGELAGQIFLLGVEEIQGEYAALFDQIVRVLVLADGDDDLLRLEGDLRDPAGGEPVGLAVGPHDARDVETVRNSLQDLTAHLLFHALPPLRDWFHPTALPSHGSLQTFEAKHCLLLLA